MLAEDSSHFGSLRSVRGQIVAGTLNIRTPFSCGIDECKENSVLESFGFVAVYIAMFVRCLEWDVIAHEVVRNVYLYCSDYL